MKKHLISLLLVGCLFSSGYLLAQTDTEITPVNYSQVAKTIYANYHAGIKIPYEKFASHLGDLVPELNYTGNCKTSTFENLGQTQTSIDVSWKKIEGAAAYKVTYLNLAEGTTKSTTTTGTKIEFQDMPDAMYLISVVSLCSLGKGGDGPTSGATIIIMDKPVLMIFDEFEDCPCRRLTSDFNLYRSSFNSSTTFTGTSVDVPWTPVADMGYFFKLQYDNGTRASVRMTSHENPGAPPPVSFIVRCIANFDLGFGLQTNTFLGTGYGLGISAYLDPSDYSWLIADPNQRIFNIRMWRCDDKTGPGGGHGGSHRLTNDQSSQKIYPNPTNSEITIQLKKPLQSEASITVVNEIGQVVHQATLGKTTEKINLNVSDWPDRMYSINIADKNSTIFQETFLKVN